MFAHNLNVKPFYLTLSGVTTLRQSGNGSNSNGGVLNISHSSRTGTSSSDSLVTYQDTCLGSYLCRNVVVVFYNSSRLGFMWSYYDNHQAEKERYFKNRKIRKIQSGEWLRWHLYVSLCVCVCVLNLYRRLLVCVCVWWYMRLAVELMLSPGYCFSKISQ